MIKRIITIFISVILLFNLVACGGQEKKRYEGEFLRLFDTVTCIIGYAHSKEEFSEYVQLIHDELEIYHQLYDIYNDYEGINNIKTINDNAGVQPVKVDQRIIDLLLFARDAYEMSEGRMNVALGAVLRIWHDYREEGTEDPERAQVPPMELLKAAAEHVDINDMVIDEKEGTVYLADPEMSLDVGGIAKGYAVEQVQVYYGAGIYRRAHKRRRKCAKLRTQRKWRTMEYRSQKSGSGGRRSLHRSDHRPVTGYQR